MKLTKSINVQGTTVPAGTELHFSNEGIGYYEGIEIHRDSIPEAALESDTSEHGFGTSVYKYDKNWQEKFGLKTKAEPWIHMSVSQIYTPGVLNHYKIVLFIWDTRLVLEATEAKANDTKIRNTFNRAVDNNQPLKVDAGNKNVDMKIVDELNKVFSRNSAQPKVLAGQPASLDIKKPAFVIVTAKMYEDKQKVASVVVTNNVTLVKKVRDLAEVDYAGGAFGRVIAASVNELEDGGSLEHLEAVVNGDPESFDRNIDNVIKKAKAPKKAEIWLCHASHEDGGDWKVVYDKSKVPAGYKAYLAKSVQ